MLEIISGYLALDHDFRGRGNFEIDGFAFHHLDCLTPNSADDGELVHAVASRCDQIMNRIGAKIACRGHCFAAGLPLGMMNGPAAIRRAE